MVKPEVYATHTFLRHTYTIGSKIIWALQIIRVKKLIPNEVLCNKYFSIHDI